MISVGQLHQTLNVRISAVIDLTCLQNPQDFRHYMKLYKNAEELILLISDFTEQLNRLAEAFHKYEIDEVVKMLLLSINRSIHYKLSTLGPGLSAVCCM